MKGCNVYLYLCNVKGGSRNIKTNAELNKIQHW